MWSLSIFKLVLWYLELWLTTRSLNPKDSSFILYPDSSVLSLRSIMHDALLIAGVIKFSLSSASFLRYCHWFWCCMQLHHFSNIQFLWGLGVMVYGLYSLFLIPNSCLFLVGFMVECYQSTATAHAAAGANEFLNFSCSLDFCLLWCYCKKANVGREREREMMTWKIRSRKKNGENWSINVESTIPRPNFSSFIITKIAHP